MTDQLIFYRIYIKNITLFTHMYCININTAYSHCAGEFFIHRENRYEKYAFSSRFVSAN